MGFWLTCGAIIIFLASLPFIRLVIKRISLAHRIKKACRANKLRLIPTKKLWFLGTRRSRNCDFHIETKTELISVKLFQMLRRSSLLHINQNEEYYCEHCIIMLFGRYGGSSAITCKTKPKLLPDYDFSYRKPTSDKLHRKLLLINPVCASIQIHSKFKSGNGGNVDIGDRIGDTEIYALKPLISHLNNTTTEKAI